MVRCGKIESSCYDSIDYSGYTHMYYFANLFFGDFATNIVLLSSGLFFFIKTRKYAKIPLYLGIWLGFAKLLMLCFHKYSGNGIGFDLNPHSFAQFMWILFVSCNGLLLKYVTLFTFGFFVIANSSKFIWKAEFENANEPAKTKLAMFVKQSDTFKLFCFVMIVIVYDIVMSYLLPAISTASGVNEPSRMVNGLFQNEYYDRTNGGRLTPLWFINVHFSIYPLNVFLLYVFGTGVTIGTIIFLNFLHSKNKYFFIEEFSEI